MNALAHISLDDIDRRPLTALHDHLSETVDECQNGPIVIEKYRRPRAAIVSYAFLEYAVSAIEQLTAPTRIMAKDIDDDLAQEIVAGYPTDAEVASGKWNDGRATLPDHG
jgi:hypothetical protein